MKNEMRTTTAIMKNEERKKNGCSWSVKLNQQQSKIHFLHWKHTLACSTWNGNDECATPNYFIPNFLFFIFFFTPEISAKFFEWARFSLPLESLPIKCHAIGYLLKTINHQQQISDFAITLNTIYRWRDQERREEKKKPTNLIKLNNGANSPSN